MCFKALILGLVCWYISFLKHGMAQIEQILELLRPYPSPFSKSFCFHNKSCMWKHLWLEMGVGVKCGLFFSFLWIVDTKTRYGNLKIGSRGVWTRICVGLLGEPGSILSSLLGSGWYTFSSQGLEALGTKGKQWAWAEGSYVPLSCQGIDLYRKSM